MNKFKLLLASTSLVTLLPILAITTVHAAETPAVGAPMNSQASFSVNSTDPDNPDDTSGRLILQSVPSFTFGTVSASQIYNGFTSRPSTTANTLGILDTRLGTNNWTLSVALAPFTKVSETTTTPAETLTGAQLNLDATSTGWTPFAQSIVDDQQSVALASSDGTNHGEFAYDFAPTTNTLSLNANKTATLNQGDQYQASLTWTLTSAGPVVPTL